VATKPTSRVGRPAASILSGISAISVPVPTCNSVIDAMMAATMR
jgi:hypothetical protein